MIHPKLKIKTVLFASAALTLPAAAPLAFADPAAARSCAQESQAEETRSQASPSKPHRENAPSRPFEIRTTLSNRNA